MARRAGDQKDGTPKCRVVANTYQLNFQKTLRRSRTQKRAELQPRRGLTGRRVGNSNGGKNTTSKCTVRPEAHGARGRERESHGEGRERERGKRGEGASKIIFHPFGLAKAVQFRTNMVELKF